MWAAVMLFGLPAVNGYAYQKEAMRLVKDAYTLLNEGKYDECFANCRQAIGIDPGFYPAYNVMGSAYFIKGNSKSALSCFNRSLLVKSDQPEIYMRMGYAYSSMGDMENQLQSFKKGLEYAPTDALMNSQVGFIYLFRKNDPATALQYVLAAQEKAPRDPKLIYLAGVAYILEGNGPRALEFVTKLRDVGEEYLASYLEYVMRRKNNGENIPLDEMIAIYNKECANKVVSETAVADDGAKKTESKRASSGDSAMVGGGAGPQSPGEMKAEQPKSPKATMKATLRTQMKLQPKKAEEDPATKW